MREGPTQLLRYIGQSAQRGPLSTAWLLELIVAAVLAPEPQDPGACRYLFGPNISPAGSSTMNEGMLFPYERLVGRKNDS